MIDKNDMEKNNNFSKSVFVVGGTGFLGEPIVRYLNDKNYQITSISLPNERKKQVLEDEENVHHILKDFNQVSDTEMLKYMKDHDYMVIALGANELKTRKFPALDFFREYYLENTTNLLRLGRLARIKKAIVMGSFYTYFDKVWPELKLAESHPYILSRVEQMETAFRHNSKVFEVAILEIPYIFGTIPEKSPIMDMLDNQLNDKNYIFYPKGGTAAVTTYQVAQAVESAFTRAKGGKAYPVVGTNIKWQSFLAHLITVQGLSLDILKPYSLCKQKRVLKKRMKTLLKKGQDTGIDLVKFTEFQNKKAYIEPSKCMEALRYDKDNINDAVKKTMFIYNLRYRALKGISKKK